MKIIIASNNQGKIQEIKKLIQEAGIDNVKLYSLNDLKYTDEIEEYGKTYYINALIKAQTLAKKYPKYIVIADDSGISVESLNGNPGVYSARYGENEAGYKENQNLTNNKLLLQELNDSSNRLAEFKAVICVIKPNQEPHFFSGTLRGQIATTICEDKGFGYDPIFLYKNKFLSQMTVEEKNKISHRGEALKKVIKYLK
ncbi:MAG: RdgB/HAM1 family non-canonical purine NTP pyrophosphatase [Mycoplasmatales bacterium]